MVPMPDRSLSQPRGAATTALSRLLSRAPLLAVLAAALLILVLASALALGPAALVFGVVALVAALLPAAEIHTETFVQTIIDPADESRFVTAFADALGDPCLLLDRRGVVIHANGAAARQFPNVVAGNPLTLTLRNPDLVQAIDGVGRSGVTRTFELHETLPSETWDKVVVAPLRRPDSEWLEDDGRLLIVTYQSLTELKRVDAMRSDFVANASHELRTPLASLLGFIDTLLGPAARDAAAREKFLGIMRGQAERMSKLIDDLLSLSRIEMHQHVRPTGSIDLAALLREVREGLQTQARAANVDIVMTLPEGPAIIIGDRNQLYEVFENLIDNAVKYGGNGKSVEVDLSPASRPGYRHLVSVTDHGAGVEPEHVPRLTERFYRIDADTSRKKKGTGLGLAIVKHIVHRHRGALVIKSKPGEGMRVDVLLP